jgi:hypothetical protein
MKDCFLSAICIFFIIFFSLKLPVQLVFITTDVVSSNPGRGEEYLIQHYVITFVSDLQQVGCVLRFLNPVKLTATILLKYCLKVALNTIIIEIRLVNTFREILLYHYIIFLSVAIKSLIILQLLHYHLLPTCHSD